MAGLSCKCCKQSLFSRAWRGASTQAIEKSNELTVALQLFHSHLCYLRYALGGLNKSFRLAYNEEYNQTGPLFVAVVLTMLPYSFTRAAILRGHPSVPLTKCPVLCGIARKLPQPYAPLRVFATIPAHRKQEHSQRPQIETKPADGAKVVGESVQAESVQKAAPAKPEKNDPLLAEQVVSNKEQRKADWAIMKEMSRYLWPKDNMGTRFRVGLSVGLLVGAKVTFPIFVDPKHKC